VPGAEDLGSGVYRIPLPLPMAGLKAVNVYALIDSDGIDLIDSGMAVVRAREALASALASLGFALGDVSNYFITHVHRDHYTLAVELRRTLGSGRIALGAGEQANLVASRALGNGEGDGFLDDLRRMGALALAERLGAEGGERPGAEEWEDPDAWIEDGTSLDVRGRQLRAINTPGHTRGHLVFHDAAGSVLFAGDHVLPHITPTIGFEPAGNRMALRDYIESLRLILKLPDARLLPAHGPVQDSAHKRADELLAHHEARLEEILGAMTSGRSTAYEVARSIRWTRRQVRYDDLELVSQLLATGETAAHLEVLVLRGQLARGTDADGTDHYSVIAPSLRRSLSGRRRSRRSSWYRAGSRPGSGRIRWQAPQPATTGRRRRRGPGRRSSRPSAPARRRPGR
jgi:glyoxylase-like metal-dependent hydrolase (beta-lactamase superfamily II)